MSKLKLFNSEEDVNTFLGIQPVGEPDLTWVQPQDRKAVLAVVKLFNIHAAHNKANNFVADWSDDDQYKYSAWHWIERNKDQPSGFGFSRTLCDRWRADTLVGSRLSVGTSNEALHIAKTFDYLYQDLYFIIKETANAKN